MATQNKNGLIDQIAAATSPQEVKKIVAKIATYDRISDKTARRVRKKAEERLNQLAMGR